MYLTLRAMAALNDDHVSSRWVFFLVHCSSCFYTATVDRLMQSEVLVSSDGNKVSSESVFSRVFKKARVRTHRRSSFSITRASGAPPSRSNTRVWVGLLLWPRQLYHNLRASWSIERILSALLYPQSAVSACGDSRRRIRCSSVFHFSVIFKACVTSGGVSKWISNIETRKG
jgi:hypothetical protein